MTWRDTAVVTCLVIAVGMMTIGLAACGRATWLEAVSFVTGALCVWLTVKQSIWNFPIGLINVATFFVVFFHARLYADAGLQVVYFVLGLVGWYLWHRGDEQHFELKVSRAEPLELLLLGIIVLAGTLGLWQLLMRVGGSASFWDALTTSISLASQWLLNRKRLESWVGWIIVDVIYVPLYAYKELYLTAMLYALFLMMAIVGWKAWRASWLAQRAAVPLGPQPQSRVS